MFNKNIDVAEIMKDIQQKAIKKSNEEPYPIASDTSDPLLNRLQLISAQLAQVNESIVNTYNYTKEHEDTALRLHVDHIKPVLLRKAITFVRRLIRKSAKFIWIEQNDVNRNLNANINALHNTQLVMANSLHVMRDLHESIIGIHNSINETHNRINETQSEFNCSIEAIKEEQTRNRDSITQLRKNVNEKYVASPKIEIGKETMRNQLYMQFEDIYRGSRDVIKQRQSYYIEKYVNPNIRDKEKEYVLDIGCGRGEWIETLRENGVKAKGVDINSEMVAFCLDLGLDVVHSDALEYIKSLQDDSVWMITGFHIIEHLPFPQIEAYLFECYRVLRYHGMVIFETPNAGNVRMGTYDFYKDPTHSRPIHEHTVEFLARSVGFYEAKIVYPLEDDARIRWESTIGGELNETSQPPEIQAIVKLLKNMYCSEDYALVATK